MKVIHVTKDNFVDEVLLSDRKVLLDFWAPWCGPCQMVGPILDEIAAERPDIKVCKVNIDEDLKLASQFRVMSIPTMLVMRADEVERRMVGARSKDQILAVL